MKTYPICYALLALFAVGCGKSDDSTDEVGKDDLNIEAEYTVVLQNNGQLTGTLLNADAKTLSINVSESTFTDIAQPQLISEEGQTLTMYQKKSDCSGMVTVHDFDGTTTKTLDVFSDLGACNLTAMALVGSGSTVYIAYTLVKDDDETTDDYFVRAVELSGDGSAFVDAELEFKPEKLAFAKNRLFVLGLDEEITGEYILTVLAADFSAPAYTDKLGFDAREMFKNPDEDIIVSYDRMHTTFDSATLDFNFTNYPPGTVPNFNGSDFRHFDSSGNMYYAMLSGTHSVYERIPAVYDFANNSFVLYAYENFLTEAQLNFGFEIENTTVVQYDEASNLLLVGYKKSGSVDKGGILRIKPIPEPSFAGNLDLDGIPYALYIN